MNPWGRVTLIKIQIVLNGHSCMVWNGYFDNNKLAVVYFNHCLIVQPCKMNADVSSSTNPDSNYFNNRIIINRLVLEDGINH